MHWEEWRDAANRRDAYDLGYSRGHDAGWDDGADAILGIHGGGIVVVFFFAMLGGALMFLTLRHAGTILSGLWEALWIPVVAVWEGVQRIETLPEPVLAVALGVLFVTGIGVFLWEGFGRHMVEGYRNLDR